MMYHFICHQPQEQEHQPEDEPPRQDDDQVRRTYFELSTLTLLVN